MRKYSLLFLLFSFSFLNSFGQSNLVTITYAGDTAGFKNANDTNALFNAPTAIAVDTNGNIYVADTYNNAIREIVVNTGTVITLAGDTTGIYKGVDSNRGYVNGFGPKARFNNPYGICVDKGGNYVYVADTYNDVIRKIWVKKDSVSTYAGSRFKVVSGYKNGTADTAMFNLPLGVALDTAGNLLVTDGFNYAIREITTAGIVSTFAGNDSVAVTGFKNGAKDTAQFSGLYGICVTDSNVVYVTEYLNNDIRVIRSGFVSWVAGYYDTLTVKGNVSGNDSLLTFTQTLLNGKVDSAQFDEPMGIVVTDSNDIYVADEYNNVIRKIHKGVVSTYAGDSTATAGLVNGPLAKSQFYNPIGLAMDKHGLFFIADNGNNVIRRIDTTNAPLAIRPIIPAPRLSMFTYPNPCTDKLIIAAAPSGQAEMIDLNGRVVWQNESFKAPYTLSITDITTGVYFLKVTAANGQMAVRKIVVQH